MKKLVAVILIALVAAAAVWVVLRMQMAKRLAAVPQLLPPATLLLLEAPDLQMTRVQWHQSDLYQIWREPAVQEWLQKPLWRLPTSRGGRQGLTEFLQLGPKNAFLAVASLENNEPKVIGGFHFDATVEEARKFIGQREKELLSKTSAARRETVVYLQHQIETVRVSHFVFASVYDNQWYFVSNNLETLKGLLDRADHRRENGQKSLAQSPAFAAAMKHLPSAYAGLVYLEPRPFVEKLMPLFALTGQSLPLDQLQRLRQVESVATAVGFEHGKMRETDFVAMPEVQGEAKLQRPLLGAAGTNTFLYSTSRVHWSDNLLATSAPTAVGLPALVQQFTTGLRARGIAPEDLRVAFGEELEMVGDWPPDARWPTLVATLPVKDSARARKIAEALTSVEVGGTPWTRREVDGVTLYSAQPFGGFVPIHPALAISDKFFIASSDAAAVEGALQRLARPARELERGALFHEATTEVPAATSAFNYVDTRLLYERTDAAARPLLLMSTAFYPDLGKTIDLTKLPPPEVVAKHLSPIVMSQRYETNGYVTESVGPVTFRQATVGVAGAVGGLFIYLRDGLKNLVPAAASGPAFDPLAPTPAGSISPTPSPF